MGWDAIRGALTQPTFPADVIQRFGSGSSARRPPASALIMAAVGILAALGPARRGLEIQPTEALRGDG